MTFLFDLTANAAYKTIVSQSSIKLFFITQLRLEHLKQCLEKGCVNIVFISYFTEL